MGDNLSQGDPNATYVSNEHSATAEGSGEVLRGSINTAVRSSA